jgi:hypothetical protein
MSDKPLVKAHIFNTALPAANIDLLAAVITPSLSPGKLTIYATMSVAGILYVRRTNGGVTVQENLNAGVALVAGAAHTFVISWVAGDSLNIRYSVTGGTTTDLQIDESWEPPNSSVSAFSATLTIINAAIAAMATVVNNIFNLVNSIFTTQETGGTLTTTGAGTEDVVYVNNAPAGVYQPRHVKVDLTLLAGVETAVIRVYYRIRPGGNLILQDTQTFAGAQAIPLKLITLEENRFGVQVTLDATSHAYDWAAVYRS